MSRDDWRQVSFSSVYSDYKQCAFERWGSMVGYIILFMALEF